LRWMNTSVVPVAAHLEEKRGESDE